jgi:hypothetical protein
MEGAFMKTSGIVIRLSLLIAVLGCIAACIGLFQPDGGSAFSFTTLRGKTVEMYGKGLYRYDTLFSGAGFRGQDVVTLFLGVPLLLISVLLYRRGSLKGGLLLSGMLAYFLYVYISMAFSAAYNSLFLVYVALFSASFFGLVNALLSIDLRSLASQFSDRLPRRAPAALMFASGAVTLVVWLSPLVEGLVQGSPPKLLDSYTTMVTYALDLAVITPATFLSGLLILRRRPLGYVLAFPLLGIIILLLPVIVAGTISQISAGVKLTPGEIIGPIAGFGILGLLAIGVAYNILRNISEPQGPVNKSHQKRHDYSDHYRAVPH